MKPSREIPCGYGRQMETGVIIDNTMWVWDDVSKSYRRPLPKEIGQKVKADQIVRWRNSKKST